MTGYVYFILDRDLGVVKVGYSKDPDKRLLSLQTGNSSELELVHRISGTKRDEAVYHAEFAHLRLHGEWFRCEENLAELLERHDPDAVLSSDRYNEKQVQNYFRLLGDGDYEVSFGKHYGERLSEVIKTDYDYIGWIIWTSDFDECIKEFLAQQLDTTMELTA